MSSDDELEREFTPAITLQDVEVAKAVILRQLRDSSRHGPAGFQDIVSAFAVERGAPSPYGGPQRESASEVWQHHAEFQWAVAEALNELWIAGIILPRTESTTTVQFHVQFHTARHSWGHTYYPERRVYDQWLLTRRASERQDEDFLFDADLFISRAAMSGAHQRVRRSIAEAVNAYKQGLHLAAATMIGSASEGAWLEFFEAFRGWVTATGSTAPTVNDRNLADHVAKVGSVYRGYAGFDGKLVEAGVSATELKALVTQYDYFRDLRNYAAHFDTTERFDLTYSGVGILMLQAARYFATIYKVTAALKA